MGAICIDAFEATGTENFEFDCSGNRDKGKRIPAISSIFWNLVARAGKQCPEPLQDELVEEIEVFGSLDDDMYGSHRNSTPSSSCALYEAPRNFAATMSSSCLLTRRM